MVFKSAGKWGMPRFVVDYRGKGCLKAGLRRAGLARLYRTILADMTQRVVFCGVVRIVRGMRAGLSGSIAVRVARQSGPANETGSAWCGARSSQAGKRVVRRAWLA
ncbi:hypothetical protein AYM40_31355 [Paraburkholderia phytofirmans OLGA172]|uniref:Uncharacterized protein n=1 Tax=Paraburkholderia phytofirmans OLGA172 TaxID=1417228 RepID=A0A160FTX9_9BURK|nr:hypothetical protein AYM40_31355 [Paraburkholderia phytofirmans OLGA172]